MFDIHSPSNPSILQNAYWLGNPVSDFDRLLNWFEWHTYGSLNSTVIWVWQTYLDVVLPGSSPRGKTSTQIFCLCLVTWSEKKYTHFLDQFHVQFTRRRKKLSNVMCKQNFHWSDVLRVCRPKKIYNFFTRLELRQVKNIFKTRFFVELLLFDHKDIFVIFSRTL